MNLFKRIFWYNQELGSKDPKDYAKDKLSTGWQSDINHCNVCKKSTGHNEFMSDICNSCGSFNTQVAMGRTYRKIYIDGKWKYQIRYRNGVEEIREEWY
jgi:hypothetical protein